ncbi:hypothetical protein [Paracoccus liaowanqingii]|nr:hypothetical protein [Paracoccus liaowanqingii]
MVRFCISDLEDDNCGEDDVSAFVVGNNAAPVLQAVESVFGSVSPAVESGGTSQVEKKQVSAFRSSTQLLACLINKDPALGSDARPSYFDCSGSPGRARFIEP